MDQVLNTPFKPNETQTITLTNIEIQQQQKELISNNQKQQLIFQTLAGTQKTVQGRHSFQQFTSRQIEPPRDVYTEKTVGWDHDAHFGMSEFYKSTYDVKCLNSVNNTNQSPYISTKSTNPLLYMSQEIGEELFQNISSNDFLKFQFKTLNYQTQLAEAQLKSNQLCGVKVYKRSYGQYCALYAQLSFYFMGGSLGCAESEKIQRAAEYCLENKLPLILDVQSGGVRMQEGVLALMQMTATTQQLCKLKNANILTISVFRDPCFGGTSASLMHATDIQIAFKNARIGFAGPNVICNTIFDDDQNQFDKQVGQGFQTSDKIADNGFCHVLVSNDMELQIQLKQLIELFGNKQKIANTEFDSQQLIQQIEFSYRECRGPGHMYPISYAKLIFENELHLHSDGALQTSICMFQNITCIAIYSLNNIGSNLSGLGTPVGYRQCAYMVRLASRYGIPIITIVDTAGALPSPQAEEKSQSQAISDCLSAFIECQSVIISIITGEGGSGGALALAGANSVACLSKSFYNVISPEGGVSILQQSVYKPSEVKQMKSDFSNNCELLAKAQKCYSFDIHQLGVVDFVINLEQQMENTAKNMKQYIIQQLNNFQTFTREQIHQQRFQRFRQLTNYKEVKNIEVALNEAHTIIKTSPKLKKNQKLIESYDEEVTKLLVLLSQTTQNNQIKDQIVNIHIPIMKQLQFNDNCMIHQHLTCKQILRQQGPNAVKKFILEQKNFYITDTSCRDAHQSQAATRHRTRELQQALQLLESTGLPYCNVLFSVECWGGATFDTCMRFLQEDPWDRLHQLERSTPNTLTQMLLRGANAVGYTRYPDNVIKEFIIQAASNGLDVFRVFDAFNDLDQMQLCCETILQHTKKLLEVCICFTGNFLSENEKIYTLDYYFNKAAEIYKRWPDVHFICIKDMAGLLLPQMAQPLIQVLQRATNGEIPIHFHTHETSGGQIATCIELIKHGVKIIDVASASVSGLTSQPCMQTLFKFTNQLQSNKILVDNLIAYDDYWHSIRSIYCQVYESDVSTVRAPCADVYDNQIPGGQISNLHQQCIQMGLGDRFDQAKRNYRDINMMFGDIIKVTPSSKVVGDLALFMLQNNFSVQQVTDPIEMASVTFPESVRDFLKGGLGVPHVGMNKQFVKAVFQMTNEQLEKKMKQLEEKIVEKLPNIDFTQIQQKVQQLRPNGNVILDTLSYCLYPKVFSDFCAAERQNGKLVKLLPVYQFIFGCRVNKQFQVVSNNSIYNIELKRIKNKTYNGDQLFVYQVNDIQQTVTIAEKKQQSIQYMVAENCAGHHSSLVLGVIEQLSVQQNEYVKKGQTLMRIASSKLEVRICAKQDGVVMDLMAEGDKVVPGCLVCRVE